MAPRPKSRGKGSLEDLTAAGSAENENTCNDGSQGHNGTREEQIIGNTCDDLLFMGVGGERLPWLGLLQERLLGVILSRAGVVLGRRSSLCRVCFNGSRDRRLGRVMYKQIHLVAAGSLGEVDGIKHVLVRGDRDGITLVVHVAEGITSIAKSAFLNHGLAANGLQLRAKLGSHLRNKVGNTRSGENVDTVHTATGSLEFEGEWSIRRRLLVMVRCNLGVFLAIVRCRLVGKNAVVIA